LHLFAGFVICGAGENVFEELSGYSTATVYECQEEAKELIGSERISCRRAAKRAGCPDFVNA
jgi:hypothetical protein